MATRKQIRESIADRIVNVFTKVYTNRALEIKPENLPSAEVLFVDVDSVIAHGGVYNAESRLSIKIWAEDAGSIDDDLDNLAKQARLAIEGDDTLDGLVEGLIYTGCSFGDEEDILAGTLTLSFNAIYEDED